MRGVRKDCEEHQPHLQQGWVPGQPLGQLCWRDTSALLSLGSHPGGKTSGQGYAGQLVWMEALQGRAPGHRVEVCEVAAGWGCALVLGLLAVPRGVSDGAGAVWWQCGFQQCCSAGAAREGPSAALHTQSRDRAAALLAGGHRAPPFPGRAIKALCPQGLLDVLGVLLA